MYPLSRQIVNQNMVFFTEWHVYKHSSEACKYVISAILKIFKNKVSMHDVLCEIINAFRS